MHRAGCKSTFKVTVALGLTKAKDLKAIYKLDALLAYEQNEAVKSSLNTL